MEGHICPKCKEWRADQEFGTSKWCPACRSKYHDRLVLLGANRKAIRNKGLPRIDSVASNNITLNAILIRARTSGAYRYRAQTTKSKLHWKMYYTNETQLKEEVRRYERFITRDISEARVHPQEHGGTGNRHS